MARRESQGLQITLIVFVMLTIILAVTTIAFWNRSKTLTEQNLALTSSNQEATSAQRTASDESLNLKSWIGHSSETGMEAIESQFKRDMATYGRSAPEVKRTYKDLPAVLFTAIQERNKQAADLRDQLKQSQADFEQAREQMQASLDASSQAKSQAEADLQKVRDEFAQYRNELNAQKDTLASDVQTLRQNLEQLQAKAETDVQDVRRQLNNKDLIINQRDDQIKKITTTSFDVPDGKVLSVRPRSGLLLINLGSADGLRRQVTFSVYGVDVNNLAREEKKGSIEVVRVVDEHTSEARITEDDYSDPILSGDAIYTPLWSSRSALRFAIAGSIDINGDGRDDRQIIKNLIRLNGGKVDAEDADGKVVGQLTPQTRYLVLGEEPSIGEGPESEADGESIRRAWSDINKQADQLGVERLTTDELLDFIGYDGEKRTLPLGVRARADDFVPRPGAERGQGSLFRDRGPKRRSGL